MYPRDLPALAPATSLSLAAPLVSHPYVHPGMSLLQIALILWAHRHQSLRIFAAVVIAAGIGCALWPRTYEATATLMVDFEVNDPLGDREFPAGLLGSYMATQVELARSSDVLLPMIERLKLTEHEDYAAGYSDDDAAGLRNWVEMRVRKNLLVEQGKYGSQLIYVTYGAETADEAARIANSIADVYTEQQHARLTGPAAERAQRYTEQLRALQDKVSRAQERVTEFRQQSGLVDADEKGDVAMQMLTTLETRLLEAQNLRRAAEARASADAAVGAQVLGSPMIQSLKTQVALQNATMAQYRTSLGPRHPQVLELQSQMAATRAALDAELHAYASNARAELESAQQLEQKLQKATEEQRARVLKVRQVQDSGAKQLLELQSAQSVYKRALEGYDQVLLASTGGYSNVTLVSRATPPPKPTKPKVGILMTLATLAGLALGIGVPLCLDLLNRRVRCRDDLERDHGIPVLMELGPIDGPARRLALAAA